jgi:hypothetical protein
MTESERAALLQALASTPAKLKAALRGVPKKLLTWTPGPGKWSILEIVAHMRDMERGAYLDRYRRILAEDHPTLPDLDGDLIALLDNYRGMKLSEVVRDWMKLRKETLKLLKGVKGARWERMGTHETAGPLSMDTLLLRHVEGNDNAHLGQIEGIKKRFAAFEVLADAPRKLRAATLKLDDALLRRKPAPDKWSAMEVACHLRDLEGLWASRIVKAAFSDRPALFMPDVDALAVKSGYNQQALVPVLKEFAVLREDTLRLLRALPAAQWKRTGIHARRGEITIERMVEIMVGHDKGHLEQIQKAVA